MLGFHFHPIMQHFAVNDRRFYPLFETINALRAAVMIDVGTTGMGAGMPGGMGARIRHAHPSASTISPPTFPNLKIIMAHPGWPWVDETTAVALHKGNVYWEMSGWAPKYFPGNLKVDMRGRLQDKIMFGSDYPSLPYARILKEWQELGYTDAVMEKIFHDNAERILGLYVSPTGLTLNEANSIIAAALAKAREMQIKPIGVVVLDESGNLKAAQREDGASMFRFDVARARPGPRSPWARRAARSRRAKDNPNFFVTLAATAQGNSCRRRAAC